MDISFRGSPQAPWPGPCLHQAHFSPGCGCRPNWEKHRMQYTATMSWSLTSVPAARGKAALAAIRVTATDSREPPIATMSDTGGCGGDTQARLNLFASKHSLSRSCRGRTRPDPQPHHYCLAPAPPAEGDQYNNLKGNQCESQPLITWSRMLDRLCSSALKARLYSPFFSLIFKAI